MALRALVCALLLAVAASAGACSSGPARKVEAPGAPPLRPLSEETAGDLRAAFDAASGETRYIAAFSPT